MASLIQAIKALGPRIKLQRTMTNDQVVQLITQRTGYSQGEYMGLLSEIVDLIVECAQYGRAIRFDMLGTFTPSITRDGDIVLRFRPAPRLKHRLGDHRTFKGTIVNRRNIGLDNAAITQQWNELHPENPVSRSGIDG
jgi:hypothetical protein